MMSNQLTSNTDSGAIHQVEIHKLLSLSYHGGPLRSDSCHSSSNPINAMLPWPFKKATSEDDNEMCSVSFSDYEESNSDDSDVDDILKKSFFLSTLKNFFLMVHGATIDLFSRVSSSFSFLFRIARRAQYKKN
jgi:hypothetical protein